MEIGNAADVGISLALLALSIMAVGWILPDFGSNMISFLTNQFFLVIFLFAIVFLVVFTQRKRMCQGKGHGETDEEDRVDFPTEKRVC
jgi:hypothetical protein